MNNMNKYLDKAVSHFSHIAIALLLASCFAGIFLTNRDHITLGVNVLAIGLVLAKGVLEKGISFIKIKTIHNQIKLLFVYVLIVTIYIIALKVGGVDTPQGRGYSWLVRFGGALLTAALLSLSPERSWKSFLVHVVAAFGLIYAASTIVFWLIPSTYEQVYPLLQSLSSHPIEGEGYQAGLTTHYSTNGTYIVMGFMSCSCLAFGKRDRKWLMLSIVCFIALVLTTKRAHFAFGLASVLFIIILNEGITGNLSVKKVIKTLIICVIVMLSACLISPDFAQVFTRFSEGIHDLLNGRENFYVLCMGMWLSSPLVGCGWGSFTRRFLETSSGHWYLERGYASINAHNVYLQTMAEQGVVGLALILSSIILGIRDAAVNVISLAKSTAPNKRDTDYTKDKKTFLNFALCVQVFFALYCLTGNPLYDAMVFIPWILVIPLAYSTSDEYDEMNE